MKNLQALRQKYAAVCDQQKAIVDQATAETRPFTAEEKTQLQNLQTEVDGLAETIKQAETMEARGQALGQPAGQPYRPAAIDTGERGINNQKQDDGGFESLGEMLLAVKDGEDAKGRLKAWQRSKTTFELPPAFGNRVLGHDLNGFRNAFSTGDAESVIPPQMSQSILSLQPESEIVLPRATFIPAGDPPDSEFIIPYFNQGANGANGGVVLVWTAEGKEISEVNKPGLPKLTLKPREVAGLAVIENATLINWRASGAFFQRVMSQAFQSGRDLKFLTGTGAGTPLGITQAPGAIKVKRKTAGAVAYADVAQMMGKLLPEALQGALWVAHITLKPSMMQLKDDAGRLIFMAGDATKGIPDTLGGVPIRWTGKTKKLGTEGDLILADFTYYLVKPGSGPFVALSEHVYFTKNQTAFRIVANVDGQPWVNAPLTLEDGETQASPYVILQ